MPTICYSPIRITKEIRKELNARSNRAFARTLPFPYNIMVNDIIGSIKTGGAFLSALGLMCCIETCGKRIIYNNNPKINGSRCFNEFLDKYMGLGFLLNQKFPFEGEMVSLKNAVRNGLVHNFIMNCDSSGIYLTISDLIAEEYGFFISRPGHLAIAVIPLFKKFIDGLKKAKREGHLS